MCAGLTGFVVGARAAGGELRGDGLADDDAAGRARPGDGRRVGARLPARPDGGAVLAGHVGGIQHVLRADGDALQRAGTSRSRRGAGLSWIEMRERSDRRIAVGDVVQIGVHQRLRPQLAIMDQAHRCRRGQAAQVC